MAAIARSVTSSPRANRTKSLRASNMGRSTQYLYTVYRRKDDLLIAFEETADKAAELMGIKLCTFYSLVSRLRADPGSKSKYDIVLTVYGEDGEEDEYIKGRAIYTVYRTSDNALICHEQPVDIAARAMGVKIKSLQTKMSRQIRHPERRYKYWITRRII